jgi:hypothetical protein
VLVVWTMEDVPHPRIFTMHAPEFGAREKRDLGPARRRRQNTQAANVNRGLLGKAMWEKPLADWIVATGVGLLGPGK